jgi:hypothetical protein
MFSIDLNSYRNGRKGRKGKPKRAADSADERMIKKRTSSVFLCAHSAISANSAVMF